jgi:hypothetical protein
MHNLNTHHRNSQEPLDKDSFSAAITLPLLLPAIARPEPARQPAAVVTDISLQEKPASADVRLVAPKYSHLPTPLTSPQLAPPAPIGVEQDLSAAVSLADVMTTASVSNTVGLPSTVPSSAAAGAIPRLVIKWCPCATATCDKVIPPPSKYPWHICRVCRKRKSKAESSNTEEAQEQENVDQSTPKSRKVWKEVRAVESVPRCFR